MVADVKGQGTLTLEKALEQLHSCAHVMNELLQPLLSRENALHPGTGGLLSPAYTDAGSGV